MPEDLKIMCAGWFSTQIAPVLPPGAKVVLKSLFLNFLCFVVEEAFRRRGIPVPKDPPAEWTEADSRQLYDYIAGAREGANE